MRKTLHRSNAGPRIRIFLSSLVSALFVLGAWSILNGGTSLLSARLLVPVAQAAGVISGTVFQDFNANGARNVAAGAASDAGVAGVVVRAFDAAGVQQGLATTLAGGSYSLAPGGVGPYRIEFDSSTFPVGFQPGAHGTSTGTTVEFANTGAVVNLGINKPGDFCQNNPQLVTNCYVIGPQVSGPLSNSTVLVSFPYTATNVMASLETMESLAQQVGTTWGLAYQRYSQTLFAAAYIKRLAGLGPNGPGAIYKIAPGGAPDGALFIDLNTLFPGVAGANPHSSFSVNAGAATQCTPALSGTGDFDSGAWCKVGKTGLGGLTISDDDATLYVVNLNDRKLYRLPIGSPPALPIAPSAGQVTSALVPDPGCVNGVARPFAVKYHDGQLFVGGVCTAENSGTVTNLLAYVYTTTANTLAFGPSPVLSFSLATSVYPRGCSDYSANQPPPNSPPSPDPDYRTQAGVKTRCESGSWGGLAHWNPWDDSFNTNWPAGLHKGGSGNGTAESDTAYPQPMLSDIEFVGTDMVVGLRDRYGDVLGSHEPGPKAVAPPTPNRNVGRNMNEISTGDVLRACATAGGKWLIESDGSNSAGCATSFTGTAGDNLGPGGGRFYVGDGNQGLGTDHTSDAGLVAVPGYNEIVETASDPINYFSGGVIHLLNTTGQRASSYQVFAGTGAPADPVFNKADGLGDLLTMCNAAPIEVGNRVWIDANSNGIQDPGETSIAGVRVHLYTSTLALSPVATATTDANGLYFFSNDAARISTASERFGLAKLTPNTNGFVILLDNPADYQSGGPLFGYMPTTANVLGNTQNNSKALLPNPAAPPGAGNYPRISFNTGAAGDNDHTLDAGFVPVYSIGNRVWWDSGVGGGVINNRIMEAGEPGIDGVLMELLNSGGSVFMTTTTTIGGYYRFDFIAGGTYTVRVAAANFSGSGKLTNLSSSTGVDGTTNDKRDRGIDSATPAVGGVSSAALTLGPGDNAPTGEGDFAGGVGNPSAVTIDARENLLEDFGFVGVPTVVTVGNFDVQPGVVWELLPFAAAGIILLAGILAYTARRRRTD